MNEKLEFYWYILDKTHDYIKSSDAKAALLLSFYGIILSLFFSQSNEFITQVLEGSGFKIILLLTGFFSLISIYFAFNAINPRLKNPTPRSIIYFGDVHKKFKTAEEYFQFGNEKFVNPEEVFRDLSDQVYVNSTIAYKKFYNLAWAIRFFVAGLVSFILLSMFWI